MRQLFPDPSGAGQIAWNGDSFDSPRQDGVLAYPMPGGPSGWNDGLTDFLEESSGGRHPIDLASIDVAMLNIYKYSKFIEKWEGGGGGTRIIEIGCSGGHLLRRLRRGLPGAMVVGADIIGAPLKRLAGKLRDEGMATPLLRFDLADCPLPDRSFDLVVALNVLEHIADHGKAAAEIYRILKPGGVFVFEVPAGPGLYDDYDRDMRHYRRYRAREIDQLLTQTGFARKSLSHLGVFMYPAFWLIKKLRAAAAAKKAGTPAPNPDAGPSVSSKRLISASNGIFFRLPLALEIWLGRFVNWPFGIRCTGAYIRPKT
ncbi:MAG: class I SAM-dependent methyltransferase [Planctomycetota bacterium]|nr:class I SAM-dependent methyltransferase [Planctomycetota bacterium]